MQTSTVLPNYDCFTINVPRVEAKRFKAIVKAFGFNFEVRPMTPLERSLEEEKSGKVYTYASLDDLIKEIG